MTTQLGTLVCGPLENNVYIVFDNSSHNAFVIDPSFEPELVIEFIRKLNLTVQRILITHAHFDHFAGVSKLMEVFPGIESVCLHQNDLQQWQNGGGAKEFAGFDLKVNAPLQFVAEGEKIDLSGSNLEVRLVPGHSAGSVTYVCAQMKCAFVGDAVFYHGISRTDLKDGDQALLLESIRTKIFILPPDTILYPGHGPFTTVDEEIKHNPFF